MDHCRGGRDRQLSERRHLPHASEDELDPSPVALSALRNANSSDRQRADIGLAAVAREMSFLRASDFRAISPCGSPRRLAAFRLGLVRALPGWSEFAGRSHRTRRFSPVAMAIGMGGPVSPWLPRRIGCRRGRYWRHGVGWISPATTPGSFGARLGDRRADDRTGGLAGGNALDGIRVAGPSRPNRPTFGRGAIRHHWIPWSWRGRGDGHYLGIWGTVHR